MNQNIGSSELSPYEMGVPGNLVVYDDLREFTEKEYLTNFTDRLNEIQDEEVFERIKRDKRFNIDIVKIKEYVAIKIPILLEKIKELESGNSEARLVSANSLKDVLGNSITAIFRKIVWLANNFDSQDLEIRKKIDDSDSVTRKILAMFFEEAAEYYIDALIEDEEKLKLELGTGVGYLEKFEEYFNNLEGSGAKNYPSGSVKAIYFRFFSEIKNWGRDIPKLTEELEKINKIESGINNNIMNKTKVVEDFIRGEFENKDF